MVKFLIVILLTATNQLVTATNENVVYNAKSDFLKTHDESERKEVCMGELGCFDTGHPFDSPGTERIINLAPDSREEIGTEFRFFSPKNKDIPQYVTNMNFSSWDVKNSGFFRGWVTYFILHGFMGGNKEWPLTIKNTLLNKERCNVIIVDWTNGHGPLYEQAVSNIRVVGAEVGLFIQRMMNVSNLYPEFVHIIGHSLGAHASGYAGKWFKNKEKKLVSRITGLDPAGPYFNGVDPAVRLDKGDADFVDVIHTNAAWTRFTGFGLEEPIGHADFFPNGGEDQTGCSKAFEATAGVVGEALSYLNVYSLIYKYIQRGSLNPNVDEHIDALACSHDRAHQYFLASIDGDCKFQSLECYSWEAYEEGKCGSCETQKCVRMGFYAAKDLLMMKNEISKKFYLRTKDKPPYCLEKA